MRDKIISKATDLFLKLGFKSVTMDDIACEMCISKKTIYKFFKNKERLVKEATEASHMKIHEILNGIISKNHNAIEENFEIRRMFKEMFQSFDKSPAYQLKKHYPDIYEKIMKTEIENYSKIFKQNIIKGISEGLYRPETDIDTAITFYYALIFSVHENTQLGKETNSLETQALEYHTRAIATKNGIEELEKQLSNT